MNIEKQYQSFKPIINMDTEILILGSLPSKKSLELGQYYGHPRNRFWKILASLKDAEVPGTYKEKVMFLHKFHIGVWDVIQTALRKGSLDTNIRREMPNDIYGVLNKFRAIRVIGFNGKKAEKIFYKYFDEYPNIKYLYLPSSSPANMSISYKEICAKWLEMFEC